MKTAAFVAALLLCSAAQSQTVWRCGGNLYSDSTCADGREVAVTDSRSAAQVQAASELLSRERLLARELVQQRQERERETLALGPGLAGIGPGPRPEFKPVALKAKKARVVKFRSAAPGTSPSAGRASRRIPG
jgi:hypothetical protein